MDEEDEIFEQVETEEEAIHIGRESMILALKRMCPKKFWLLIASEFCQEVRRELEGVETP